MALLFLNAGQRGGQLGRRIVPREVYAAVILQVPVHANGHINPVMATHDHLLTLLVELEELLAIVLQQFNLEFLRCTFVDALQ